MVWVNTGPAGLDPRPATLYPALMPTTDDVTAAAKKVGEVLADHAAVTALKDATKAFRDDPATQRALLDFNRALQEVAAKEQQGQPIEVSDKHKLRDAQDAVVLNPLLGRMQQAQMDYFDLLRKIDASIQDAAGIDASATAGLGGAPAGGAAPAAGPPGAAGGIFPG